MNKYSSMPRQIVEGLDPQNKTHPAGQQINFHYHDVEEWLEVRQGKITFFPAGDLESADAPRYSLVQGEALKIPRGEIHRVDIGPEGVTYQMWVPVYDGPFSQLLNEDELSLIRKNLQLPEIENRWEARNPNGFTAEDEKARAFLNDFLSEDLNFRTASGKLLVGKMAYLDRPPAKIERRPSTSIRVIHNTPESILIFTVVHTQSKEGGNRKSFSNLRLFIKENNLLKCRLWINHPEYGVS